MGWNSWNHFGCDIDAEPIHQPIDAMVESGMRDAGDAYVNLDDRKSADGQDWTRVRPLFESSGDRESSGTGEDPRASLWSPMPVYDDAIDRWTLTYGTYTLFFTAFGDYFGFAPVGRAILRRGGRSDGSARRRGAMMSECEDRLHGRGEQPPVSRNSASP